MKPNTCLTCVLNSGWEHLILSIHSRSLRVSDGNKWFITCVRIVARFSADDTSGQIRGTVRIPLRGSPNKGGTGRRRDAVQGEDFFVGATKGILLEYHQIRSPISRVARGKLRTWVFLIHL